MDRTDAMSPEELAEVAYVKENMWKKYDDIKHPPMAEQPVAPFPYHYTNYDDYADGLLTAFNDLKPGGVVKTSTPHQIEFFPDEDAASASRWGHTIDGIAAGMKVEYARALEEQAELSANDIQINGDHYKKLPIETWDYIAANNLDYFQGNVVKYITRWKDKDGIADLKKAQHYLQKYLEIAEAKGEA
jgi:hypothetical protein